MDLINPPGPCCRLCGCWNSCWNAEHLYLFSSLLRVLTTIQLLTYSLRDLDPLNHFLVVSFFHCWTLQVAGESRPLIVNHTYVPIESGPSTYHCGCFAVWAAADSDSISFLPRISFLYILCNILHVFLLSLQAPSQAASVSLASASRRTSPFLWSFMPTAGENCNSE